MILNLIIEGIVLGLTLAILMGPIFIALTSTAIERGARAGLTVGIGIWISDFIIIAGVYLFVHSLNTMINNYTFQYWMGLLGGFILITFGIGSILKKAKLEDHALKNTTKDYVGFFTKGFLVNTINPFTFVFWIGVTSTYVIGRKISITEAFIFLGSIMLVVILTDSLKVILAKMIRKKLKAHHINILGKVAGIALIVFGLVLLYRTDVL